jgi:hypothetical protein
LLDKPVHTEGSTLERLQVRLRIIWKAGAKQKH